ncbi:hypothetical protein AhnVgp079 [Adoxophyes honmai nucleopolyhedrovirus]|uniref:P48 n=1 Tax=Adoxophyes honmai nucleopolyhedrovirus TaxID=224399 RepID=Q80LL7_NPVAH|nr:hypothetical protein AhnVgp079 [Adoxophyes honmai nucleopolyhedrovirus]BAC67330.1 hypothetical protein [Adoxophyes honmai nucleopolyhedrovirus]
MNGNSVNYTLKFSKNDNDVKTVNLIVHLQEHEIESMAFLFSKYYDQKKFINIKGLTFHSEFRKCIDNVKQSFDSQQNNSDLKKIFTAFLNHEFMNQVKNFKEIMQYLQKYYKPMLKPSITEIGHDCKVCPYGAIQCLQCKIKYLSVAISHFDETIQKGWDIFLRPMFGIPILLNILIRTDYTNHFFSADDLITNAFARFFNNILCDRAHKYLEYKMVQPLIDECHRASTGLSVDDFERLLCILKSQNTLDNPLYAPFRKFMLQLCLKTKIKNSKINKIASVVFTGLYLRLYLESAINKFGISDKTCFEVSKQMTPFEMEIRNVCRFILNKYTDHQFERFMLKLANIKRDLVIDQYIIREDYIRKLMNQHKLDDDIALLLNQNV